MTPEEWQMRCGTTLKAVDTAHGEVVRGKADTPIPARRPGRIHPVLIRAARRAIDILASLCGLLLLSPLLVAVGILIRSQGGGPALFLQERMGRGLRPFTIYKFRTMVPDADRMGGYVTVEGDQRITPLGRWLRHHKVDELPQLLNVLKGDMSLVGPRPEMRSYVELFRDEYEILLRDRPGITDPAALRFSQEEQLLAAFPEPEEEYVGRVLPEKLRLSLQYAGSRTIRSDLRVVIETVFKVSAGNSSDAPA